MSEAGFVVRWGLERFAQMPEELLFDPALSAEAVRLWGVLARYANDRDEAWPSRRTLAKRCGQVSPSTIDRAVAVLVKAGWVQRHVRKREDGSHLSTLYTLTRPTPDPSPAARRGGTPADQGVSVADQGWSAGDEQNDSQGEREPGNERPPSEASPTPDRPDVDRVCRLFSAHLDVLEVRHTVGQGWREAARLMLDRDRVGLDHVEAAIQWLQEPGPESDFWRTNVLSVPTLRAKWDQLRLAAGRQRARASPGAARAQQVSDRADQFRAAAEQMRRRRETIQ